MRQAPAVSARYLYIYKARLFLLALCTLCLSASAHAQGEDGPALADPLDFSGVEKIVEPAFLLPYAGDGGEVGVLVLLEGYQEFEGRALAEDPEGMRRVQAEIRARQDALLYEAASFGFHLTLRWENILGFAGTASFETVRALASLDGVEVIEEDRELELMTSQALGLMNAVDVRNNFAGEGVSVAVVDTGVNYNHAKLGAGGFPNAKVIGGYDFGSRDADPMDDLVGHGTWVAGLIAGDLSTGPGDYVGGVAHAARIYALKTADNNGQLATSAAVSSWDWCVTHKNDDPDNPILIISNSWGAGGYTGQCDSASPAMSNALNNCVANGQAVFVASGNMGLCNALSAPACMRNAISVGAVYDANIGSNAMCISPQSCTGFHSSQCWWTGEWACEDNPALRDHVTCYSNSSSILHLLAPAEAAATTDMGGGYISNFGGTSAACPYAAGAGAILQSQALWAGSPMTPEEIRDILISTGDPVTDSKNGRTTPRVNLGRAAPPMENCGDGTDNDGDTFADCDDPDCNADRDGDTFVASPCGTDCDDGNDAVWSTPAEVSGLRWVNRGELVWDGLGNQAGLVTHYQVFRGEVSNLPVGSAGFEICLAPGAEDHAVDWGPPPTPGMPLYFLVRGINDCPDVTGRGTYGADSGGTERISLACP